MNLFKFFLYFTLCHNYEVTILSYFFLFFSFILFFFFFCGFVYSYSNTKCYPFKTLSSYFLKLISRPLDSVVIIVLFFYFCCISFGSSTHCESPLVQNSRLPVIDSIFTFSADRQITNHWELGSCLIWTLNSQWLPHG